MIEWAREEKKIRQLPPKEQKKARIKQAKEKKEQLKKEKAENERRVKAEKKILKEAKRDYEIKYKDRWAAVRNKDSEWFDYWFQPSGDLRVVWDENNSHTVEAEMCNTGSKKHVCWVPIDDISPTKKYT